VAHSGIFFFFRLGAGLYKKRFVGGERQCTSRSGGNHIVKDEAMYRIAVGLNLRDELIMWGVEVARAPV
jgi:hypothetical protein